MTRCALRVLVLAAAARGARAQDGEAPEVERVPVLCVTISGDGVYLDRGRDAHLQPGDELRLFVADGALVTGTITAVSATSARAEVLGSLAGIVVGTRGEVLVPSARGRAEQDGAPAPPRESGAPVRVALAAPRAPPDHPPWTRPPEEWNADVPLLAPAHARAAAERERRLRGSLWTGADLLRERGNDSSEHRSVRGGIDLELENPFARADELVLEADLFARESEDDGGVASESALRLERASYRWGGVRGRPSRYELGRFLQHELPELGVLDGLEVSRRLRSGSTVGASLGFLPELDDFLEATSDLQAAFSYRHVLDEAERLALGAGYQKTWHEGAADRDLVLLSLDAHPAQRASVYAGAKLDYYTGDDEPKSAGLELTQLFVNAQATSVAGHSLGLYAARSRLPALERGELSQPVEEQIADAVFDRIGLRGRYVLSPHTELRGAGELWRDQDDSGGSASARLSVADRFWEGGELAVEPYFTEGKFHEGLGVRAMVRHALSTRLVDGQIAVSWDGGDYERDDFDGPDTELRHVLRASFDAWLGDRWTLATYVEQVFGEDEDGSALGFFLRRSIR